jgi:hypothetical protein
MGECGGDNTQNTIAQLEGYQVLRRRGVEVVLQCRWIFRTNGETIIDFNAIDDDSAVIKPRRYRQTRRTKGEGLIGAR